MRDWTPYKSDTIKNINALDPIHEIAGDKYRHSECVDIHRYWQGVMDRQDVLHAVSKALELIDNTSIEHPITCFFAENCSRLADKWCDKLRNEWRPRQEELIKDMKLSLLDFIIDDLKDEYKAFKDANGDEEEDE